MDHFENIEYRARSFVQGTAYNHKTEKVEPISGAWHERFLALDLVREAERDGWSKELRAHVVRGVKMTLMRKRPLKDPLFYMPDDMDWIDATRKRAAIYRQAQEWQMENAPALKQNQREWQSYLKKTTKKEFTELQRSSPNQALHRTPHGLTELSKRMTGEQE